ncbi:protein FAR1-RELATED SEQUENCE 5-like [Dendrobium catenatum]|uniref:protein FAR1-RELATED SEQUENCE 5-like n=1 Tax=Dendrobium catenatum TaxID=906689 RepID=UPI0009F6250D|nr:protein FAR1-RELATED SEQUENCE 5-like [Dendrobium catenatum]
MEGSNLGFALEDFVDFEETLTLNYDQAFFDLIQGVYNSEKEAYEKYCKYAHSTGFSVRKDHHHFWLNSRKIKSKDFVCSKAGFKKVTESGTKIKYRRSCTKTGCLAMVRFYVSQDGIWGVNKAIETYNHELARPDDQYLLRSSRSISDDNAAILKSMSEAGIRIVDAFIYLSDEVGGVGNLDFIKRDAYNYIQKERKAKIETEDTNSLIKLFKEWVIDDNMFAWDVETDKDGYLLNFFWVDGLGRIDYDYFGDVIIFDTSYCLNKYNLACAPIVGVNNHW